MPSPRSFHSLRLSLVGPVVCAVACSSSSPAVNAPPADGGATGEGVPDGGVASDGGVTAGDGGAGDGGMTGRAPNGLAWKSGTRLRAVLDTADGAHLFKTWHDTQLDIDCVYSLASDGKTRCLPSQDELYSQYDDMNCTNPVGRVAKTAASPKYLAPPYAELVCGKGSEFHAPGASYAPAAVYSFSGTSCQPDALDPAASYYHFGAVVPASTFVAETEAVDPRGARLSAHQYVGEDGSWQDFELLDASRGGAPCHLRDDGTGKFYCTPLREAYIEGFFSDMACSIPAAFHPEYAEGLCAQTPTAVLDSTGKTQVLTYYEVGAKVASVYGSNGPSMCKPYTPLTANAGSFYGIGAPLPLTSLLQFATPNEGAGRIQLRVARTESGALGTTLGFFDATKNVACDRTLATDGAYRCLPRGVARLTAFVDASCTQGVYDVEMTTPPVVPPPAGAFLIAQSALVFSNAIFALGAKIATPAMVWQWNGASCEQGAPSATADYYATTAVPPTDFVVVTTATE